MTAANSTKTAKKIPGRPFVKGQSGNPNGRPKENPEVKEILKAHSVEAALKLVELMNSEVDKVALKACCEILDRTMGKPEASGKLELSGKDTRPVVFTWKKT